MFVCVKVIWAKGLTMCVCVCVSRACVWGCGCDLGRRCKGPGRRPGGKEYASATVMMMMTLCCGDGTDDTCMPEALHILL